MAKKNARVYNVIEMGQNQIKRKKKSTSSGKIGVTTLEMLTNGSLYEEYAHEKH